MARKQMTIPGTGRKQHPEVERAADEYRDVRDERMELTKREVQKKMALLMTMQAHKITKYKFDDAEGEEMLVELIDKIDVKVRKTGEAAAEVGEGVPTSEPGAISNSLIAQAMKAQEDINVEQNAGGDIVVPDKAAPKSKRAKSKRKP